MRLLSAIFDGLIDLACVPTVVASTVGQIVFLGLLLINGLSRLFGIPNMHTTQAPIKRFLIGVYDV